MPNVALLVHPYKASALEAARRLADFLAARGVATCADPDVAAQLASSGTMPRDLTRADFAVVFGGDGTLLGAARRLAPHGVPLLGVHLGHFGFMNETDEESLETSVSRVLAGNRHLEERLMLHIRIQRAGQPDEVLTAMNDCVVACKAVRMTHVRVDLRGEEFTTYSGDGILVGTPTGSTGYSLSAGGPLVHPSAPVLLLTPISPHTLSARAVIIPEDEVIHMTIVPPSRDVVTVAVDGQIEHEVNPGDSVTVTRAPHRARFLSVGGPSFYQKIRERWHYGERAL